MYLFCGLEFILVLTSCSAIGLRSEDRYGGGKVESCHDYVTQGSGPKLSSQDCASHSSNVWVQKCASVERGPRERVTFLVRPCIH